MAGSVGSDDLNEMLDALSGRYVLPLPGGNATLVCAELDADCVSAAVIDHGHLYVFIDLRKAGTHIHARQMLREWMGGCRDIDVHSYVNLVAVAAS